MLFIFLVLLGISYDIQTRFRLSDEASRMFGILRTVVVEKRVLEFFRKILLCGSSKPRIPDITPVPLPIDRELCGLVKGLVYIVVHR